MHGQKTLASAARTCRNSGLQGQVRALEGWMRSGWDGSADGAGLSVGGTPVWPGPATIDSVVGVAAVEEWT
jgi:hypothetical protein